MCNDFIKISMFCNQKRNSHVCGLVGTYGSAKRSGARKHFLRIPDTGDFPARDVFDKITFVLEQSTYISHAQNTPTKLMG